MRQRNTLAGFIFLIILCLPSFCGALENRSEASGLYARYSPAIYQVQVISRDSNKKYAIGSGFQISDQGDIATNYHVIADALQTPQAFRILVLSMDGQEQEARAVHFDIVHDLALVQVQKPASVTLSLGSSEVPKGVHVFSFGNPRDVGMTVVEGLSNGYREKVTFRQILTTVSLNPGMSGGPTLDQQGQVVGINVATAGNDLSFLVPVEFLKQLRVDLEAKRGGSSSGGSFDPVKVFESEAFQQLVSEEDRYLRDRLARPWPVQPFGKALVPGAFTDELSCWGSPGDHDGMWLKIPYLECGLQNYVYISHRLRAQHFSFNYSWASSEDWDPLRFYRLLDNKISKGFHFEEDRATAEDVGSFSCRVDTVSVDHRPVRMSSCARPMKKFKGLYDLNVIMVSLGEMQEALVMEMTVSMVTSRTAKDILARFLKEIRWAK